MVPVSQEFAFTGVNGVRLKISVSTDGGRWHCLDCWQFGDVPPEAEVPETERRAHDAADEHARSCPAGFGRNITRPGRAR